MNIIRDSKLDQILHSFLNDEFARTEKEVLPREDHYPGLPSDALYTSLEDFRRIQSSPLIQGRWVDLGAGIGQSIMSYLEVYPDREALGLEISEARVKAGQGLLERLGLEPNLLSKGDLLTDEIPRGGTYFLYFPTGPVLDRILSVLSERQYFRLVAIESHGDLFDRLDLEPCLRQVGEVELTSKRHNTMARIYEKAPPRFEKMELFARSFSEVFLVVSEEERGWLGETHGAEWIGERRFNLVFPPRTIHHDDIEAFLEKSDLDPLARFLVELRRRGEVQIHTGPGVLLGDLRKIYLRPAFCLELSGGQKVKWDDIIEISLKGHRCYDSSSPFSYSLPAV